MTSPDPKPPPPWALEEARKVVARALELHQVQPSVYKRAALQESIAAALTAAVEREREECAKLAESHADMIRRGADWRVEADYLSDLAEDIRLRARGGRHE